MPIKRPTKTLGYGAIARAIIRRKNVATMLENARLRIKAIKSTKRLLVTVRLYKKALAAIETAKDTAEKESDLWAVLP